MKKPLRLSMVALLVCSISALAGSQPDFHPDFRKVNWGMTPAQVMATEPDRPADMRQSDGETVVKYESAAGAELPGRLIYIFVADKLVRAKYISNAEHAEKNDFIADFHAVEPVLSEKYGKPAAERAVFDSDELQLERLPYLDQDRARASDILASDPYAGLSVSLGQLRLYTQRADARTKIVHALTGGDSMIFHQIEFRSVDFEGLEKQAIRTAAQQSGQTQQKP